MKKIIYSMLVLMLTCSGVTAQIDPHFSQYYAYPVWLNPALTGAVDGDYRITANYRNQWSQLTKAFSTVGVSADFQTAKTLNFGVNVLRQTAGEGGYQYTNAYATLAYTGIRFGENAYKRIVFALQAGVLDRRFDVSKLTFGDQWNPVTGYNSAASFDAEGKYATTSFDAGAGVLYFDGEPNKRVNIFAGASAFHITRPDDKFKVSGNDKIPVRWAGHGGARIGISDNIYLTPNFLYMRQGNQSESMLGAYAQFQVDTYNDFLFGAYYRVNDAVVPFAGLHFHNMVLGVSYDANASSLRNGNVSPNAFEISLSIIGRKERPFAVQYFVCPRL